MKNARNKYKWIFLLLINGLPFMLVVILYPIASSLELFLFLPVFAGLTVLNYMNCKKTIPYILYQAFILICIICAGYASTSLYYHHISNDFMTPVVGEFMTVLQAGINIIATFVTAIVKAVLNSERTRNSK